MLSVRTPSGSEGMLPLKLNRYPVAIALGTDTELKTITHEC